MLVGIALAALALPVVAWTGYLAALALLSRVTPAPAAPDPPRTRFEIVVPAHDEEQGIGTTVASLLAIDYPASLRRVTVVADNCTDATAARASEAGVDVLERNDPSRRGKGYALAYAFERALARGAPAGDRDAERDDAGVDAIVVVDADTRVTPNLLRAFDARFRDGARAAQAYYCVANASASWRTRLMHIGFTLFHDVRSRARERVGVSAGLRGNGMAFSVPLLREVPHEAFSVVEDVEYGIRLGLAGRRVHYAGEARVFGDMVSSEQASRSQRRRWEGGRLLLARRHAPGLLAEGVRRRSLLLVDLALDLLVPPITYVALAALVGASASLLWVALAHGPWWTALPWGVALLGFATYVLRGIWLARVGPRVVLDLAWAPVYMVWKVILAVRSSPSREGEWVRTAREGEKP
jgi:cellulose synthase/poly-beta-1,6-N-acetylglucosamine synthase-like glycosyltransferase